uniref:Uncharacterized protein n=1 Tax=Romanomermis culicivorax TaxID=13658 RepID=A0A915I052_ROMCU
MSKRVNALHAFGMGEKCLPAKAMRRNEFTCDDRQEIVREKERDRPISHKWKYYKYHQFDNDYWFDQHSETPKFFPTYTRARYYFRTMRNEISTIFKDMR